MKSNPNDGKNQSPVSNSNETDATIANTVALQQQMLFAQMQHSQSKSDEINLGELWHAIWSGKLTIIFVSFIFAVSSIVFALSQPNIYKASTILAPVSDEGGMGDLSALAGQFGGLASMAGIDLGGEIGRAHV